MFELPNFEFQECRLKQIVLNADLRNGHEGLIAVAKGAGASVEGLRQGEIILFMNTARTAFKALIGGQAAMFHFREPTGRVIHREVIFSMPRWFRGGKLAYNEQLKRIIEKEIRR